MKRRGPVGTSSRDACLKFLAPPLQHLQARIVTRMGQDPFGGLGKPQANRAVSAGPLPTGIFMTDAPNNHLDPVSHALLYFCDQTHSPDSPVILVTGLSAHSHPHQRDVHI